MTSIAISRLPKIAGKAMFNTGWNVVKWVFTQIFNKPLLSFVIIAMSVGSLMSVNNALFLQSQTHPSPFFAKKQDIALNVAPIIAPIVAPIPAPIVTPMAPIPAISKAVAKIDHAIIISLQNRLVSLGFLSGKVDGFYGSDTANAIRSFEKYVGRKPVGALTPAIAQEILNYKKTSLVKSNVSAVGRDVAEDPLMKIVRSAAISSNVGVNSQKQNIDAHLIEKVQKGLISLGFLYGKADGVMGQATARAIREFEVFQNYKVSGEVSLELLDMLKSSGASI